MTDTKLSQVADFLLASPRLAPIMSNFLLYLNKFVASARFCAFSMRTLACRHDCRRGGGASDNTIADRTRADSWHMLLWLRLQRTHLV